MTYLLIVVLLIFSAFFSGAEIAYTSVNRVRLKKAAEDGKRGAALAERISDRFDSALSTILIGNSFVNIAASSAAATVALSLAHGSSYGVVIATAVITVVIIIFGEILPKIICKQNSEKAVRAASYPLVFFIILFYPITFVVSVILRLCSKIWGDADDSVTEEELATLIESAEEDGGIDEEKSELLQSALEFNDITLEEIITHRTELLCLDVDADMSENIDIINSSRHSRLPVYKDTIDNIVGILNINQFYKEYADNRKITLADVMLKPTFMHSTTKLPAALMEMRENQLQMVVVLDEYGGTLGAVTTEDILEEIVGDIWDESDEIVVEIKKNDDGSFTVLGDANVYDMFDELDVDDHDFESDCYTAGGWCVEMLEHNPEVGMSFEYKNIRVEVTRVNDLLVDQMRVTVEQVQDEE